MNTAAEETTGAQSSVQIAQPVMRELRNLEKAERDAILRTIERIPRAGGKPISLDVPDAPNGEYFALAPFNMSAPVVIYRRYGDGTYLVTALLDRDKYRAYLRAERKGLLDDPVVRVAAAAAAIVAAGILSGSRSGKSG